MKKYLNLALLPLLLNACQTTVWPQQTAAPIHTGNYALAASHWADVSKIRNEGTRLGYEVSAGRLTKAQAAQQLNRFRINLIGRNPVDDDMYEIYLRSAIQSQQGRISQEQSKVFIQNALRGWQQRWPNMQNKPANPAFTNFLMEIMQMQPLR